MPQAGAQALAAPPASLAARLAAKAPVAQAAPAASANRIAPAQTPQAQPAVVEAKPEADRARLTSVPSVGKAPPGPQSRQDGPGVRLKRSDPIVDAPSIGPRMAERLAPFGIKTVADLLTANAAGLAQKLNLGYVSAAAVADWQAQAQLVCTVPGLSGTGAQLLVGAGYRTAQAIGEADPEKLGADVLRFATSPNGQRLLRNGNPPDMGRIKLWAEAARSLRAA
ncbi:MAG: DUF4332 domain-containing protein [Hyphomicrobiaceae bacterium]